MTQELSCSGCNNIIYIFAASRVGTEVRAVPNVVCVRFCPLFWEIFSTNSYLDPLKMTEKKWW